MAGSAYAIAAVGVSLFYGILREGGICSAGVSERIEPTPGRAPADGSPPPADGSLRRPGSPRVGLAAGFTTGTVYR